MKRWMLPSHSLTVERQAFLESIGANGPRSCGVKSSRCSQGKQPLRTSLNTPALGLLQTSSPHSVSSSFSDYRASCGRVPRQPGSAQSRHGMGEVYRGVRGDGVYDQHVAVKIVRPGAGGEFSSVRFRNERQILAKLDHPNIATILDGGTTEGRPVLFCDGVNLTECPSRNIAIRTGSLSKNASDFSAPFAPLFITMLTSTL